MSNFEKRFQQIFDRLCDEDYSTALTLICPLIDSAGKKIYGIKKPGERFKKVLTDNNSFLYWMMSNGIFIMEDGADLIFSRDNKGAVNLSQSIYKFVRNSLLHEAELSAEIEFVDEGRIGPDGDRVVFPKNLIWALAFMLTYLECYSNDCPKIYSLSISGIPMPLSKVWGNKEEVMNFFNDNFYKKPRIS
ncbi:hypothetical protein [Vibrio parahaemolyticus]|uniref:hypothetical protein n=1 Tax=Vibrio parahaemolyticus TaxID=670 RepID=UPI00226A843F|nr:hypothetical protein [Vibrio parahaemolyticus]MCX8859952.1 hypothetical protein [Vibrio parahaemolyticus]MCX8865128.1 hypothetical protein [Vibrio parahaemolyticus]MCX8870253.1 hypothetical protein [Vibrio parahaemolyticus]MCX8900468.1 hypothetical protein [Vibrio parahaemolyticus]MCX8920769.1 hypothetical protein [Vibrio parahaemolyticus]